MSADDDARDHDFNTEFDDGEEKPDGQALDLPDLGELIRDQPYLHYSLEIDIEAWVLSRRDRWASWTAPYQTGLRGC